MVVTLQPITYGKDASQVPKPRIYDTLERAVSALDDLGFNMNWAIVNEFGGTVPFTTLFYQGWIHRSTPERHVVLPFGESDPAFTERFRALLRDIFAPFMIENEVTRPILQITPHTTQEDCWFATLFFAFRGTVAEDIKRELDSVDDEHVDGTGTTYYLD
jgi:hypothetical protein